MRIAVVVALLASCRSESAPAPPTPSGSSTSSGPVAAIPDAAAASCATTRSSLGPGLAVERWTIAATPATPGPACIDVVRADPARFALRAFTGGEDRRTAPTWLADEKLAAVTNAGMFHESGAPVGLVISNNVVRGSDNAKMSGFLAWDPVSSKDPPAIVAGRGCPGFDLAELRRRYRSLLQSYRFLGCDGAALPWKDAKQYSAAGIGVDRSGRIVFLHARAGVTMAELATALGSHDLAGALFLEGGPEASLVARGPDGELSLLGSYETGFVENDDNREFWKLPNVIGIAPR
jgi:phosphodiester glycosidase